MKKYTYMILIAVLCVAFISCSPKTGKITSSSRYVTPTMLSNLQKEVDKLIEEDAETNGIGASVSGVFKKNAEKEAVKEETSDKEPVDDVLAEETTDSAKKSEPERTMPKTAVKQESPSKQEIETVSGEEIVYVSKTGKKFHKKPDCSNMTSSEAITRAEAEKSGKTYCKKCYE